jgi:hypothetical protein
VGGGVNPYVVDVAAPTTRDHLLSWLRIHAGKMVRFTWRGMVVVASVDNVERSVGELHISVSRRDRWPSWDELVAVKRAFWPPEAQVVQFIPGEGEYVNIHPNCFHLVGDVEGRRRWMLEPPDGVLQE